MGKVLQCLCKHGLYIKAKKCEFHKEELSFLGYRIGPRAVSMEENKVAAVSNWPVKDLQRFLGFTNFHRRFISGFSTVAAPLTDLLREKNSKSLTLTPDTHLKH